MTDFLTKIIAKAVEVCCVTYTYVIAAGTRLKEISVLFPDLPKICVKQRPQSQSSGITVDISAEDVSYLFGKPLLRSNASLVECSPDGFVCAFCTWPKLKSSSGVGRGTKQGNDTGIIRKPSSICSRVCAGWSLDDNSSSSRCGHCVVALQIKLLLPVLKVDLWLCDEVLINLLTHYSSLPKFYLSNQTYFWFDLIIVIRRWLNCRGGKRSYI